MRGHRCVIQVHRLGSMCSFFNLSGNGRHLQAKLGKKAGNPSGEPKKVRFKPYTLSIPLVNPPAIVTKG